MKPLFLAFLLCVGLNLFAQNSTDTETVIHGTASFYSKRLDGTKTSTGEVFRNKKLTGASNHFKLNTWVRVTNLSNNKSVIVRINDRMHTRMVKKGRVIDVSRSAAKTLGMLRAGIVKVKIEIVPKGTTE
jgi:rare lipoprotein A